MKTNKQSLRSRDLKQHIEFDIDFRRNPYKGKLIVLEGLDGSGKTTQSQRLVESLEGLDYKAKYTKEPTEGPIGTLIKQILWGDVKLSPRAMQYLYVADRADHSELIEDYLKKGVYVIADRYFWSSVAYGSYDMDKIDDYFLTAQSILSYYHRFLVPDVTFYLDIDPEKSFERVKETKKRKEMYKDPKKMKKIKKGYDFLLEKFPEEFTIIDANKSVEEVNSQLIKKIKELK